MGDPRYLNGKVRTGHIIADISFSQDYILCICGWKGSRGIFSDHQRASPVLPKKEAENMWRKLYSNSGKPSNMDIKNFRELSLLE